MANLTFDMQSMIDVGLIASGILKIDIVDGAIEADIMIKYSEKSTFKPKTFKTFHMKGLHNMKRFLFHSSYETVEQQISVSISLGGLYPTIYYSMISPLDCGIIKPCGNITMWKEKFAHIASLC